MQDINYMRLGQRGHNKEEGGSATRTQALADVEGGNKDDANHE